MYNIFIYIYVCVYVYIYRERERSRWYVATNVFFFNLLLIEMKGKLSVFLCDVDAGTDIFKTVYVPRIFDYLFLRIPRYLPIAPHIYPCTADIFHQLLIVFF